MQFSQSGLKHSTTQTKHMHQLAVNSLIAFAVVFSFLLLLRSCEKLARRSRRRRLGKRSSSADRGSSSCAMVGQKQAKRPTENARCKCSIKHEDIVPTRAPDKGIASAGACYDQTGVLLHSPTGCICLIKSPHKLQVNLYMNMFV